MSTADEIREKNRRTIQIGGLSYVVRRLSAALLIAAFGKGAFALLEAMGRAAEAKDVDLEESYENVRKLLAVAMVDPPLGEGGIDWEDMGDDGIVLFNELMEEYFDLANFTAPSADQGEPK